MNSLAILGLLGGIAASALVACNGTVAPDDPNTGGGGGGGTSNTTAGPLCVEAHGFFDMRLQTPSGAIWSCDEKTTEQGDLVFTAQVLAMDGNAFTLDACSPAADCMPIQYDLTLASPGLHADIPVGSFVEVSVHLARPWGCEHAIQIRNVASWDGYPNPVHEDDRIWLVAADGSIHTFADTPFTVERKQLGCPGEPNGCGPVPVDTYSLLFGLGAETFELHQGEVTTVTLPSTPTLQYLDLHNLRSFQPAPCDNDWNWGYLAVQNMGVQ